MGACADEVDVEGDRLHASASSAVLLSALPWLSMCVWGFSYSAASLHYRSSGWEIWHLGVVSFAGNACRPLAYAVFTAVGSWAAAPMSVAVAALVLPATVYPDSELAVATELLVEWGFIVEFALQEMCFSAFGHSRGLQLQASRVQMLSGTLGYAMSPFIGGVLYDLGGWHACAGFHLAIQSLIAMLLCSSPFVSADWKRWRATSPGASDRAKADAEEEGNAAGQPEAGQARTRFCCLTGRARVTATACSFLPQDVQIPCLAVAVAAFGNAFAYQCEWSTYALYFREVHSWTSSAWAGLAQMAGDVLGAVVIAAAAKASKAIVPIGGGLLQMPCCLLRKPYHLVTLLGMYCACHLGLTVPSLHVAVTSQVLMGTVYVFFVQGVKEMNMFYAFGDARAFMRIQYVSEAFFNIACAFSSAISVLVYDGVGHLAPFYLSASVSVASAAVYAACFAWRVGRAHPLEEFELKRRRASGTVEGSEQGREAGAGLEQAAVTGRPQDAPPEGAMQ